MQDTVNVSQSQSGTPQRWQVLAATFLSYFYDSYDLIILSIAMPVIINVLGISLSQGGLLSSVSMIGAMVGSIVLGVVAENKGRKFAIILSLVWFGIATFPVIFITHFGSWMVLRFFTGFGIGGVWGPAVALLTKHWNAEYRARANSFMLSTFALGGIAAAILGRFSLSVDWRILFLVGSTSILVAIYCYFAIPADETDELNAEKNVVKEKIGVGVLFKGGIAKITILATLLNVANMGGYWGVSSWVPTYLKTVRGLSVERMANFTIVMYIGMFIGYQAWSSLADKIGRKKVMAICFLFDMVSVIMYLILPNEVLFWWGAVVGFGFGGVFGVMGAYYGELFPERFRALAGGFCFNIGRLGSVLAPFTVGLIGQYYGLKVGLEITPAVFALGLIAVALLPETMQKKVLQEKESIA
ncbi:putative sialic acid transporter [Pelotomaculum schinkii]|uniref:Putative sialic acid transporter n=1 Tax=Pelotomaculum schinkii TaxID=78350 RepID=A0A4Y7RBB2_9FIRM|nr:MFS transporter [Pelotomaculum schinkii]TEB06106.1 putative sialic acid transporter [Pelotomaculum schinkii]